MIIVLLQVYGRLRCKKCKDVAEAEVQAAAWLAEAKKSYPHSTFTPEYFSAQMLTARPT